MENRLYVRGIHHPSEQYVNSNIKVGVVAVPIGLFILYILSQAGSPPSNQSVDTATSANDYTSHVIPSQVNDCVQISNTVSTAYSAARKLGLNTNVDKARYEPPPGYGPPTVLPISRMNPVHVNGKVCRP